MVQAGPSVFCLSERKVFAQRFIKWVAGYEQLVIHACGARSRTQLFDVRVDLGAIGRFDIVGHDLDAVVCFKVNEEGRAF
jgi:hypothetical protein